MNKTTLLQRSAGVAGLIGLVALSACSSLPSVPATTAALPLLRCENLVGMTVAAAEIGLPSGRATVSSAVRNAALAPFPDIDGEHLLQTAERCLVLGAIAPVDPAAQPINFAINLPMRWNGRALQSGGGGLGGAVITAPAGKGSGRFDPIPLNLPYPINLGYATFGSDGGHPSAGYEWAYNDEVLRNWGTDELKKTRDVALKIITAAYASAPTLVFFSGESAGGREALMVAQKFPNDYDGVIATSPVLSWNYIHISDNRARDRLISGFLDAAAIKLVADKTRASCDTADGLKDGVIAKYLECRNDVAQLRCAGGVAGTGCLSDAQIASVNAVREPFSMGVTLAHGINRYPGYGVTGEEDGARYQYDFYPVGTVVPSLPLPPGRGFEPGRGAILNFAAFWIRNVVAQDANFEPYLFDARPYAKRLQYLSTLFDATDPDLSKFAARNGKLIIVQPPADNAVGTPMVAEYYRSVVARMGQSSTDAMLRFYVAPSGGHNASGTAQIDTLGLLENWVVNKAAPPDSVTAVDMGPLDLAVKRSMPACKYPMYARYNGSGDVNAASSFTCTARTDPLAFDPQR